MYLKDIALYFSGCFVLQFIFSDLHAMIKPSLIFLLSVIVRLSVIMRLLKICCTATDNFVKVGLIQDHPSIHFVNKLV